MAIDYSKVKSTYLVQREDLIKVEEIKEGVTHRTYEEIDLTCNLEEAINLIAQYVTEEVKMIHFAQQVIKKGTGIPGPYKYDRVVFMVRFLGDDWEELRIAEVKVSTDLKYGYSFLASALKEKFPDIAVCAKKLAK